jgi:xanthine/CO dehydrogenase XdhC/CoxF family maturation factor
VGVEDLVEDLLDDLDRWRRLDLRVAIARVVDIDDRPGAPADQTGAPVPDRTAMAVNERGEIVGARWAGCAEGAVVAAALDVMRHDRARLVSIGHSGDQAYSVGLAAGGTVHVLLEPLHW